MNKLNATFVCDAICASCWRVIPAGESCRVFHRQRLRRYWCAACVRATDELAIVGAS